MTQHAPVEDLIALGGRSMESGDWRAAAAAFEQALAETEVPEAMRRLAEALFWLGDVVRAREYLERAHAAFKRRPDPIATAACALQLDTPSRSLDEHGGGRGLDRAGGPLDRGARPRAARGTAAPREGLRG
jgi:hypothetical protein